MSEIEKKRKNTKNVWLKVNVSPHAENTLGLEGGLQGQEKRRTTTVWLQRPQTEAGRWPSKAKRNDERWAGRWPSKAKRNDIRERLAGKWPSKAKRNDERLLSGDSFKDHKQRLANGRPRPRETTKGGLAGGRPRPRRTTNGVEREVEGFFFFFFFFSGHGRHVKTSLPTRHRQAGTRQGLACWREFEYLEKAKDGKTRAKKRYPSRTRAQLRTHSCYTQDRSMRVQSSRGSRSGRVQSKEHFIMQSMTNFIFSKEYLEPYHF